MIAKKKHFNKKLPVCCVHTLFINTISILQVEISGPKGYFEAIIVA